LIQTVANARDLAGTPLYMAPEVLDGAPASVASDIYSLGVLLYYLATASFPIAGRTVEDLRDAHRQKRRTPIKTVRPDLPKSLAIAIDRAADPDPGRRYASAADLEAALVATIPSLGGRLGPIAGALIAVVATLVIIAARAHQSDAVTRSALPVRDSILVSRFDNRTGDATFDGGIEYAIAQELRRSDQIDVVPNERIVDALQLMKRPVDTIVDRTLAREVSLRDGHVTVFVSGRVERSSSGYATTMELIDPLDDTAIASVVAAAPSAAALLPTIRHEVPRLAALFQERRPRIKGAVPIERVSTSSLKALRLYNESLRLVEYHEERAEEGLKIISGALAEDPSFAVAWIHRAELLRQSRLPGKESADAIAKAIELSASHPDWERLYIRAMAERLNADYASSARDLEIVVHLRPDFEPAWEPLVDDYLMLQRPRAATAAFKAIADRHPFHIGANARAAYTIVGLTHNIEEARPYIQRVDELIGRKSSPEFQYYWAARWRRMLSAYEAWIAGNIGLARSVVDREAARIDEWPESERRTMLQYVGFFYITLGRLHDANRYLHVAERYARDSDEASWPLEVLAEAADDVPAMQQYLRRMSLSTTALEFAKAQLFDEARRRLDIDMGGTLTAENDAGRGLLELSAGHAARAVELLQRSMSYVPRGRPYQSTCAALVAALLRVDRRSDAIQELERCVSAQPTFMGNFVASPWMRNLIWLADEYRIDGRASDAERIERQLRKLLVYADADSPLVVRLNRR